MLRIEQRLPVSPPAYNNSLPPLEVQWFQGIADALSIGVAPARGVVGYQYAPAQYIRDKLGWEPWAGVGGAPGQVEVLEAYSNALRQQHESPDAPCQNRIRIEAGHTVGKCVIIYDMITLSDGTRVQAADLIGKEFKLLTLVDGVPTEVSARAELNGIEPVYELVTDSGKRITRNAAHPLYSASARFGMGRRPVITAQGFTPMADLVAGDLVAVAEALPAFGTYEMPEHEIKILAYLLGDGGYTRGSVRFSQTEGRILDDFKVCAEKLGCTVNYIGQYDYILYSPHGRTGGKQINPALNLLRTHGMMKLHSRDKRIPEFVYQLSRDNLRLFLSRLFATDGWASVDKNGKRDIGFTSASKGLIEDIIYLLQKLGVHARLFVKPKVHAWNLTITDASDQVKFIDEVGIFGKEEAVSRVDVLARATHETKQRNIKARPDRPRWWHKEAPKGTRWEKIKAITLLPEEPTVAIEVPIYDTYLTQFWEHNTKLASGIVNHFFDCFQPSIIYTFAPTWEQIHDLLWKEIKSDRRGKDLPGRILDLGLEISDNHFAKGRATSNAGGQGTERAQGQHGKYLMFVLDEAEGIDDYVWDAVESMTSGGISIVLMLANPRTRISQFHKAASDERVISFRISCLQHPNVIENREIVPGAVKRAYVDSMVKKHCEVVEAHNEDAHTFELPWQPRIIYEPDSEFLFRVRGIAPANMADNTFVPVGRYEAATKRAAQPTGVAARMGVDVARYGKDRGTLYIRRGDSLKHIAYFAKQDTGVYYRKIRDEAMILASSGVTSLHIRVDGGGGFGGGVIDRLNEDEDLRKAFEDFRVLEVHFNGTAADQSAYADVSTEMYAHAAEALQVLSVSAPDALEQDLCERTYKWVKLHGVDVKKLTPKEDFKKDFKRSPDDGDGAALAAAPDYAFGVSGADLVGFL